MDERMRENLLRGRDHYAAREYGKAEPFLAEMAESNLEFADVYDMLGVIYHQQGRLNDAESMFRKALALNPNYTEAALNLAVTYNDLGKYQDAKEIYGRAMSVSRSAPKQLDPFARGKIANMHAEVGGAYHEVGQFVDAVREYEKALALCPAFHDIRTKLGATLREMGSLVAAAASSSGCATTAQLSSGAHQPGSDLFHHGATGRCAGRMATDPEPEADEQVGRHVHRHGQPHAGDRRR